MDSGIEALEGRTLLRVSTKRYDDKPVEKGAEEIYFRFLDGATFKMFHQQDCCETVYLEDIIGCALGDFVGETILAAYKPLIMGRQGKGRKRGRFTLLCHKNTL